MIPRNDPVRRNIQSLCFSLYRLCAGTGLFSTALGRTLFQVAYRVYKRRIEASELPALRPFAHPGTAVIDVGASIGFFTLPFAEWVGGSGRVFAFEPEEVNFLSLERALRSSRLADRVETVRAAVTDHSGTCRLTINPHHPGDHRLGEDGIPVDAVRLDDFFSSRGWPPVSLIKIDVQGAEERVIAGAEALLRRYLPALFIEVDDDALHQQGSSAGGLLSRLVGLGYRPFVIKGGQPAPLSSAAEAETLTRTRGYADILFLPQRAERRRLSI